jgi:cation diffusion facilitator family transporter
MKAHTTSISTVFVSVLGNLFLSIVKFSAGLFGNSFALIADAIESTADVFSSSLVLFGIKYANRPADKNHPYGHGRIEPLITFVVVGILMVSATIIAYESIRNIRTAHDLPKSWTLYVLFGIILWKEILYRLVMRQAKILNSSSLKAEAWHHRSDSITSLAAFFGISIALFLGKGYESADDWAALFAAGFIFYNSYKIARPALGEMMDEQTYIELENEIRQYAIQVEGILGTEKCYIRKNGFRYNVDLHAIVDGTLSVKEGHKKAHNLVDFLKNQLPQLDTILVHIEPNN